MRNTWYKTGDWNSICDVCGFKFKASELKERWDGMRVCKDDWEPRHPLDLVPPIRPEPVLPWTRPEATDVFVDANYCTPQGKQAISNYGTAGCAIVGVDLGLRD